MCSIASSKKAPVTRMAVAEAMPSVPSSARTGRRPRLRSAIRADGEREAPRPARSSRVRRKWPGAGGRMASAGGRRTAWPMAPAAPTSAAARASPAARTTEPGSAGLVREGNR